MDEVTGGASSSDMVLGAAGVGGIIWAIYEKFMRYKVESANSDSNVAVANANEALFNMLTNRLEALEAEVKRLSGEITKEREYNRVLVGAMMTAGIPVPAYPA